MGSNSVEQDQRVRPSKQALLAAKGKAVPDLITHRLKVLFCGINPGLYSAWSGHHFARPGNRFWPALFAGGFTERLVSPYEERLLLPMGYGITNLVERGTLASDELSRNELIAGRRLLEQKVSKYRPGAVAVLGVSAYRIAFERRGAEVGPQDEKLGDAVVWVLPNPSGLNAHFTPKVLAKIFRKFRKALNV